MGGIKNFIYASQRKKKKSGEIKRSNTLNNLTHTFRSCAEDYVNLPILCKAPDTRKSFYIMQFHDYFTITAFTSNMCLLVSKKKKKNCLPNF